MIVGSNRTEASVFMGGDPAIVNLTEDDLVKRVSQLVPTGESRPKPSRCTAASIRTRSATRSST